MNDELKTKEYLKSIENIKLADSSRLRMREELLAHARFHATPEKAVPIVVRRSPFMSWMVSPVMVTLSLVLLVGTTTSLLAKEAAPGDFLYAVKTKVNDNILSFFKPDTKDTDSISEPSGDLLADATSMQAETTPEASQSKDDKNDKSTKVDKTVATNARVNTLVETSDAAAADSASDLATAMSKGTVSVEVLASDIKLRGETLRNVIKKHNTALEPQVKAEFKSKLDTVDTLVFEAEGKSNIDARTHLDKAALLIGEVEATLSTLGRVIVTDGVIVDVEFGVDVSVPPTDSEDTTKNIEAEVEDDLDVPEELGL